ncbi:hypothetical protein HNQ09_001739 [Deinococcus budaensis]|uniref:Uncharacterized protein n=1 Tax=Deinococcus budaensis TaxID=1665626 RepID=A0A7W8GFI1_9DEIO|nr:hypothetical protein [Deinococcus budaensis]
MELPWYQTGKGRDVLLTGATVLMTANALRLLRFKLGA